MQAAAFTELAVEILKELAGEDIVHQVLDDACFIAQLLT